MSHIQYIDKHIIGTVLLAGNKLRTKKGKYQWSPSFGRPHTLVTY